MSMQMQARHGEIPTQLSRTKKNNEKINFTFLRHLYLIRKKSIKNRINGKISGFLPFKSGLKRKRIFFCFFQIWCIKFV